ncbi:aldo/keto reductase [Phycicoccus sp. CSK15P-2]|nr:aldo/keto reductase [Phycicoccus sp. CSK15P-2]
MSLTSYVTLGRSGLRVSPLTLGTMTFGPDHGWGAGPEESHELLAAYLDRGGNSIDTANIYTNGHSEAIIGDHLSGRPGLRDRLVLGSKFFWNLHLGDPNGGGPSRKAVISQLEDSLRRLRTDYLDIYWLHNFDPTTPAEETLRALDDLVTAGKVRYVGYSDVPAWATAHASTISAFRGWAPIVAVQVEYSLLERTSEGELVPMAEALGMGVMAWGPLRSGFLSGKYGSGIDVSGVDTARGKVLGGPRDEHYPVIDAVNDVAAQLGVSPAAVALAWVQGRGAVSSTLVGARSLDQLTTNLDALDVELPDELVARLDAVSTPTLNFPAANNAGLAAVARNGGATVDGVATPVAPMLAHSAERY